LGAVPDRLGNTEYISTPHGDRDVRRWDPIRDVWKITSLGRSYFSIPKQETIFHVLTKVYDRRLNGSAYCSDGTLPVDDDEATALYTQNGNLQEIKNLVLQRYQGNRTYEGALVISEYSQEIAVLRGGPWRVSTFNTTPNAEGPPDIGALLERPLGALTRPTRLDRSLVYPDALQMRDGKRCVVIQMGIVLEMAEAKLEDNFDEIVIFWRDAGSTAKSILVFTEKYRIHTTVLYNDEIFKSYKAPNQKHCRCMSFCIEGGHALFLKNPRVLLQKKPPTRKLRQDPRPNAEEFMPYEGLADGTYWLENLDYWRQEFLNQGLCIRITVSSPHCLKSLTIEKCKILKEPEHGLEIREWLSNLGLPWYGGALPAASLRGLTSSLETAKEEAQRRRENKNTHGT